VKSIAIMQPYFFPYIGYFQMMNCVDEWIVFDETQYIRHGWINRNRVLSQNLEKKWDYISYPILKQKRSTSILNTKINNSIIWKKIIIDKLYYYKKIRAPFFDQTISLIEKCLSLETNYAIKVNLHLIKILSKYLDIHKKIRRSSECNFNYDNVQNSGDWAYEISKQIGANSYVNPISGYRLFNQKKFKAAGIKLKFIKSSHFQYKQSKRDFVSKLSIIDVLMFNSINKTKKLLNNYDLF
jgi:hypothetical protein